VSVSTHVLDTSKGLPAAGVVVVLKHRGQDGSWAVIGQGATDADGRVRDFGAGELEAGTYRLEFDTGGYFGGGFYPEVGVTFELAAGDEHLHVPLLVSPYGFTTYKGT